MDKYQAEATFCKNGKNCESKHVAGTWSPIYDQSFKVELENGIRFLSNFQYSVKATISKDPTKDSVKEFSTLKTGDYEKFDSHCDKTMVGFVQTMPSISDQQYTLTQHKLTCFYATQETHYDMEKTVAVNSDQDKVKISVITQQNKIVADSEAPKDESNLLLQMETESLAQVQTQAKVLNRSRKQSKRFNAHMEHEPYDNADSAISFINNNNFLWKADTCKLTAGHPERGSHCEN